MKLQVEIYNIVKSIPAGKLMTYGQIAEIVKTSPRHVGNVLHLNPDPKNIPCHRVVRGDGGIAKNFAFGGLSGQTKKLQAEGVEVIKNRVDLRKYLF